MPTERDNLLRVVRFERPDYIPMHFHINAACWHHYPQDALQELMVGHPFLFPRFEARVGRVEPDYGSGACAAEPHTDPWGYVLETTDDGIAGMAIHHPLQSWDDLDRLTPPDPDVVLDWDQVACDLEANRQEGRLARGSLPHGHTFLTLTYIRGYENLILDMADGEPRLDQLIAMVEAYNSAIVQRYLELGVEWMGYPEDLGMQAGPMISPRLFRQYIHPVYQRLMAPARQARCIIHMHSDGDIRELVDDLLLGGVQVINLQDLVNGIDWIADRLAGKVCIDLDIDRQRITRFGTSQQVDNLILEEVQKLGSQQGGLMMTYGLYPGVPLENVKALMDAMSAYATYYA